MSTPLSALPVSLDVVPVDKKKKVLLVDASTQKRDVRADAMRKLGMDVDCAADITEARCWWRPRLYDLVLINQEKGRGHRDKFCDDIRSATPPQRLAFLVGQPGYLADSPSEDESSFATATDDQVLTADLRSILASEVKDSPQRWGILEASRRISAVRSACTARSRALQDKPAPVRDYEVRAQATTAPTLDDLLREEMR
jgi:CheY-like chemotaxis protein